MTESVARKARAAIKLGQCVNTVELMTKFKLSLRDASRCERVVFGREFIKGRIKFKR